MRIIALASVLATLVLGCSASDGEVPQAADEGALATGVIEGLYFLEGALPQKDAIEGLRLGANGKGDLMHSWSGSPTRVRESCAVKGGVKTSARKKVLTLECPVGPLSTYEIVKNDGGLLELANADGEKFTLVKVDPAFKGDALYKCDSSDFTARVAIAATDDGQRALVSIKLKNVPHGMNTPLAETFWLSGRSKLTGVDIKENDYDLEVPSDLGSIFETKLGFVNTFTPFQQWRVEHTLKCSR